MKLEPGAQVTPNVRLIRPLGEGGMGHVWVAQHKSLGTEVAVKFLGDDFMKNDAIRGRFAREAAAAAQVKSSHAVKVYDYGVTDTEVPFIVMELLDGVDLGTRIRTDHKLPPPLVATIVAQLCKALQSAHDASVIHRDVKPENIFLGSEGGDLFVKLLDFGVAKSDKVSEITLKRSTMAGESLGTPYYMSPEQYKSSKESDRRSDLWAVGVVVYEALTGEVPFDAENLTSLAITVNEARAKPPTEVEPTLPKGIDAWFAKACARNPAERFQSARELSDALYVALSLQGTPRTSIADTTNPRVIVPLATTGDGDQDLSLRETAFASTGAQVRKRSRMPLLLGIGALASVIGIAAFLVTRPPTTQAAPTPVTTASAAIKVDTLPSATAQPSALIVVPAPTASIATPVVKTEIKRPGVVATATAAATATATAAATATASPTPSASAKSTHEQIW